MPAFPDQDASGASEIETSTTTTEQSGEDAAFEKMRRETDSTRSNKPRKPLPDEDDDDSDYESRNDGDEEEAEESEDDDSGDEDAAPAAARQPKFVPHAAMHEERVARQAADAENRRLREERAAIDERFRIVSEAIENQRQPEPEADPQPDPNIDPIGAIAWNNRQIAKMQAGQQEQAQRQEHHQRQTQEWNQFTTTARQQAADYIKSGKDPEAKYFDAAYQHVKEKRLNELTAIGYSPDESANVLMQEEANIIARAARAGKNPARAILDVAKVNGWTPPKADPDKRLDRLEDTQRRNGSLSSASKQGESNGAMTAKQWLKLPLAEAEAWAVRNPKQYRRIAGG